MAKNKLNEWIKKEESVGYSKNQLKESMLNQGYLTKEINKALKSSEKGTSKSTKPHLNLPIAIISIISLIFLVYMFEESFILIIISTIILGLICAIIQLKHKTKFIEGFTSSNIATIISASITTITYIILTYIITYLFSSINIIYLQFVLITLIFIFIWSYKEIKPIVFKTNQDNIPKRKLILKQTIIITLILTIIILTTTTIIGIKFAGNFYDRMSEDNEYMVEDSKQKLDNAVFIRTESISDSTIVIELSNKWTEVHQSIINRDFPAHRTNTNKLKTIYTGELFKDTFYEVSKVIKVGMELNNLEMSKKTLLEEYEWIKNNIENNQTFYDNTNIINEHSNKIRNNIDELYPQLNNKRTKKDTGAGEGLISMFSMDDGLAVKPIERTTDKLLKNSDLYQISMGSIDLFQQTRNLTNTINEKYSRINTQESEVSKLLRLKILETLLAEEVFNNCETYECRFNIIKLTQVKSCDDVEYNEKSLCRLDLEKE